jgi:hypothetical protein
MAIQINISNKATYTLITVLILITIGGFAFAYNSGGPPSTFGHSAEELEISFKCVNVVMVAGALVEIYDLTGNNVGITLDQAAEVASSADNIPGISKLAYGIKAKGDWVITGCAANLPDHYSDDASIYQGICTNAGSHTATTLGTLTAVLCKLG